MDLQLDRRPFVVGLGGAARAGSSTEQALNNALAAAAQAGARTECFGGETLAELPLYRTDRERTGVERRLVEAVRAADGVIVATPGYHGGVSGLVKNALDLLEDLSADERPYLDSRAVGCIVTGYGWQTCGTTLSALRSIVHALRGWPTPFGAIVNVSLSPFGEGGACMDARVDQQLGEVGRQVVAFARMKTAAH